jgi:peroxiredoxin
MLISFGVIWEITGIMKKISFLILVFCLFLFIAACGQEPKVAKVGEPAPNFSLVDRNGIPWTLSELKGQVVFINFWATWCSPCREEMPSMQTLYTMLPKDKFKMLAILYNDYPELADTFAAELDLTMPILHDRDNKIGQKYGLIGLPETYIVDKQGVLREKFIGPSQWDSPELVDMLTKYINE